MEGKDFNCSYQHCWAWVQRAEVCSDLIMEMFNQTPSLSLADVGCGDQKLRSLLEHRRIPCRYQGYDLIPQSNDVVRFDAHTDILPTGTDLVVMLGVIEYLRGLPEIFQSLAGQAPFLILSHVIKQSDEYTPERRRELQWINHLSRDELVGCLNTAQYEVLHQRMDKEKKTILVACRSKKFNSPVAR